MIMALSDSIVEVFKTDVLHEDEAKSLIDHLAMMLPNCKINFDLDDCDKILRIEGLDISVTSIKEWISAKGYFCEVLD